MFSICHLIAFNGATNWCDTFCRYSMRSALTLLNSARSCAFSRSSRAIDVLSPVACSDGLPSEGMCELLANCLTSRFDTRADVDVAQPRQIARELKGALVQQ